MLTESEILMFIQSDKGSDKKRKAQTGQRYYDAIHDILDYRLFYFNADGKLVEDLTRSNIKIPHPFFTELADQEVQYILSGKDSFIRSDVPELQQYLDEYFDDDFVSELNEVLTGAVTKGFEYMYAYKNAEGKLCFQDADSLGVVEVKAKDTQDKCDYVIYYYTERIAKDNKTITHIQVWDSTQAVFYVQDGYNQHLELDDQEKINPRPHVIYKKDDSGDLYYEDFGYIPFFRLDNNRKQLSGLHPIKALIDDYDLMDAGLSNNLVDFDNPLHVVKGFQGDNLDELQQNLKTKKMIGVDENGNVEVRVVDIPFEARKAKLSEDEKNIYRFGMGFNSAQMGDGNVTNVVIKSRYALLDLKCNKLERRLRQFLKRILKVVLKEINDLYEADYQQKDVYFQFDREVMTNASDNAQIRLTEAQTRQTDINTLLTLASTLDNETVVQLICDVLDINYEDIKEKLDEMAAETETKKLMENIQNLKPESDGSDEQQTD